MNSRAFERRWAYGIASLILLASGCLFLIWTFSKPAVSAATSNQPLPIGMTWSTIALMDLGIVIMFGYLSSGAITQLLTHFSEAGINQPAFPHRKFVGWHNIQHVVGLYTGDVRLISADTQISLNPNLYRYPSELIQEIRSRTSASSFPTTDELHQELRQRMRANLGRGAIGAFVLAALIFYAGNNSSAIIFGTLAIAYGLYSTWKWVKTGRA